MFEKIKEYLIDNIDVVVDILEELEFNDIRYNKKDRITCALPDGDNYTSVVIYKNTLVTRIHSRNNFDFQVKDFVSLIAYVTKSSLHKSVDYLSDRLGLSDTGISFKRSEALKKMKKLSYKKRENQPVILNEYLIRNKNIQPVEEWVKEGIDEDTQLEFEVFIDEKHKRWSFPLRDKEGKLIGFNGRTYVKDFEILRIPKYYRSITYPYLYNIYKALPYIKESDSVIIVEGEKSVMKLWSMGFKNVVALGTHYLCEETQRQLLSLGCSNLIFAFDKGIDIDKIKLQMNTLKSFKNVWVIYDEEDLLGEKDAPVDKGFSVWLSLYARRVKI